MPIQRTSVWKFATFSFIVFTFIWGVTFTVYSGSLSERKQAIKENTKDIRVIKEVLPAMKIQLENIERNQVAINLQLRDIFEELRNINGKKD